MTTTVSEQVPLLAKWNDTHRPLAAILKSIKLPYTDATASDNPKNLYVHKLWDKPPTQT